MTDPATEAVTRLLRRLDDGDAAAADELLPLVYEELHSRARRAMADERAGHTLQTTALVHEAWMRARGKRGGYEGRDHFLAVAARAMRRVLVDHARAKRAAKRGGEAQAVPLDEALAPFEQDGTDLLALDEALQRLAVKDERMVQVVELRYFAGLTLEEVGRQVGLGRSRVHETWELARAWLRRELGRG